MHRIISIIITISLTTWGYSQSPTCTIEEAGTLKDSEGNVYSTVRIGNQWWMSQNLRSSKYSNGVDIPGAKSYEDDPGMDRIYGKYYSWPSLNLGDNNQGPCPEGWHIPTDDEWFELETYVGMSKLQQTENGFRGLSKVGSRLIDPNYATAISDGNCTGLSLIPSGVFSRNFVQIGEYGFYYTSTLESKNYFWVRVVHNSLSDIHKIGRITKPINAKLGYNCRCVKD